MSENKNVESFFSRKEINFKLTLEEFTKKKKKKTISFVVSQIQIKKNNDGNNRKVIFN